jgi:hypothetical protein
MKNYRIKVTDRKTKEVLEDHTALSNSKKYLDEKYRARYRFHPNLVSVKINRLIRKPGIQVNLLDMIKEVES